MNNEIPKDCDLLFLNAPTKDITEDEKNLILSYMQQGGKVFVILGENDSETPNLDAVLKGYGMEREDGYIADMERCYQGNYYYIFPEITAYDDMAEGLSSNMVLLVNSMGLNLTDPERETVTVTDFMSTSSNAYAVTAEDEKQGTYILGAVATESIEDDEEDDIVESRLTVIASDSLVDSQVTDTFASLENTDLFMNAVSCNFDDVENVAIEPKSLEVTYNTMQHAGLISLCVIFVIPAVILIYGFMRWWKRRKA